jgi:hypothetical protein
MHGSSAKKIWEIVRDKVLHEVHSILKGGPILEDWNDTTIVLIPKVAKPKNMKHLRPTGLSNVLYKILSKVLSKRLKVILLEIISPFV